MLRVISKTILIFIIAGFVECTDFVYSQEKKLSKNSEEYSINIGWIKISANHPIQRLWIDSLEVAVVGGNLFKLPVGSHQVLAMPKHFESWMLRTYKSEIEIINGDTLNLHISFPEYRMIQTNPFGAKVFLAGLFQGETPYMLSLAELKRSPVTLQKEGYRDTTLRALNEKLSSYLVRLVPDNNKLQQQQRLVKVYFDQKKRDKKYALLTFGLSLVSGTTALLLKGKADRNYDRYKNAGDPEDIQYYFNQTEKFDRFSAGAYVVFEINLIASTYFLFRSIVRK